MEKRKIIVLSCAIALSILLLFSSKSINKSSIISIDELENFQKFYHDILTEIGDLEILELIAEHALYDY